MATSMLLYSCGRKSSENNTLFARLQPDKTGIRFVNEVTEDDKLNVMTYEYMYNGNGVAVGDINNDGLPDIYFTGNMVSNKLYLNKGSMQFEDITEPAGVAGRKMWTTGVTMADVNGDGLLDIYVCYSGPGEDEDRKNELYINNGLKEGIPVFTEKAAELGLDAPGTFSTQGVFFDMDLDGDLDFFLVNHGDMFYNPFFNTTGLRNKRHPKFGNRLYRNDNGKFVDISEVAGIYGGGLNFGLGVSISDINNDGWPDIYVTNDYNEQDFLYLNNKNGEFREALKQSMGHISQSSMGCDIEDYNNDLLPDIVTLDMLAEDNRRQKALKGPDTYMHYATMIDSGFHFQNMRNMLQLNLGVRVNDVPQFGEIGQLAGIYNTDWSWAPLLADFDNDGWKDLFITNGYLRDFTNLDFLKYTFAEAQKKAKDQGRQLNTWELVKDLPTTRINNYIFSNNRKLGFSNTVKDWGFDHATISTGAAYADLDNDGDLDLVVCNTNQVADIYENQTDKQPAGHYLKVELSGPEGNSAGLGAKVFVSTDSTDQLREMYTTRGFQSGVPPVLHFGLGAASAYKLVKVVWPDGKINIVENGKADTLLRFSWDTAKEISQPEHQGGQLFTDYTSLSGLNFRHMTGSFVDFKFQPLLPYQLSKQGPHVAKGDVNGDGLEDIFIGGTLEARGKLYLQTGNVTFVPASSQPWANVETADDAGVILFDADGDGDLDLFITKGGSLFRDRSPQYQCELYINDGKGNFKKANSGLPELMTNSSCIAVADYDKDGDLDIFIGGRSKPGEFPVPATSYLLRNESKNGVVQFEYASEQPEQNLRLPGMVTTCAWGDLNGDGWPDLVVAGEFMPVTVFENENGKLINRTESYELGNSNGLWSRILLDDIDGDGDIDIIAGNVGLNTRFQASVEEPLSVYYNDFDNNGSIDPVISAYVQGKPHPYNWLDELAEQIPSIKKKFPSYDKYADATFDQVFTKEEIDAARVVRAFELASVYYENKAGKFIRHTLPLEAQFSAVQGIVTGDWNGDGRKDLAIAGNFYSWRPQLGKADASPGWILYGDGNGNFHLQYPDKTGFLLMGDIRDLILLNADKKPLFVATRNNGPVSVLKVN